MESQEYGSYFIDAHRKLACLVKKQRNEIGLQNNDTDEQERSYPTPDQTLSQLGAKNAYVLFVWLAMSMGWFLAAGPMMVSAFIMGEPCTLTENTNGTNCVFEDGTLAKEYNLSGNRAKLADAATSAFLLGQVLGAAFMPFISDLKGRRAVVVLCMLLAGFIGCISIFSPNIYVFIAARFFQGSFFTGLGTTPWVLAYESIPMKLRSWTPLVFGLIWIVGYCAVGPFAYWLRHWRHLMLAVSGPILVFGLLYYFILPESFHFLISNNRITDVNKWLKRVNQAARWSGTPECTVQAKDLCENFPSSKTINTNSKTGLFSQLKNNRQLLAYTLVFVYLWTCDNFVYYGLSLFSTQLSGDRYLNFALVALVEIPSYVSSPFLLNRLGRKLFISLCHLLASASFFAIIFLGGSPEFNLAMWLVGKFGITCAFTGLFVYASEVFPTVVRNRCIGLCNLAGVGGACAPAVRTMSLISPIIPTLFFGTAAGIAALITLLLPETLNRELPDLAEQICHTENKLSNQNRRKESCQKTESLLEFSEK